MAAWEVGGQREGGGGGPGGMRRVPGGGGGGSWEGESWQGNGILGGGVWKEIIQEGRRPPKEQCRQGPLVPRGRVFTCHRAGELHVAPSPFREPPPRAQAGQGGQARERGDQVTGRGGAGLNSAEPQARDGGAGTGERHRPSTLEEGQAVPAGILPPISLTSYQQMQKGLL